jgi:ABC-2 type transport system permease protein
MNGTREHGTQAHGTQAHGTREHGTQEDDMRQALPDDGAVPRSREAVALVARRELTTRIRSRAYRAGVALMVLLVVGTTVVLHFVHGGGPSTSTVGLLRQDASLAAPLESGGSAAGQRVVVRTVPDLAAGFAQLRDGTIGALVSTLPQGLQVTVDKTLDSTLRGVLGSLARERALDAQIVRLGGRPAQVAGAEAAAGVRVAALEPSTRAQGQHLVVGIAIGLLIYLSLMTCGPMIAQGVVEEKSSRVVELLLATVRPWQLMSGKVIGTGLLGLAQVALVSAAGLVSGWATGTLTVSLGGSVGLALWGMAWFLAGFALYALLFAASGALVSRQEDLGGVQAPVLMPIVAAWVVGISVLPASPGSGPVAALSMLPPFAPVLMPMRIALGPVPLWQSLTALALTLALAALMVRLAARIYRNSVLRSGARVGWREALRAA